MAKFRFTVRTPEGRSRRGRITEATLKDARSKLNEAGYQVIELLEEPEIEVHQAPRTKGGPKPQRARIIEFETSLGERLWEWLNSWILRKEMAAGLLMLGMLALLASWALAPKKEIRKELEYHPYTIAVEVDCGSLEGSQLQILLPDLPFKKTAEAQPGSQTVEFELELTNQPSEVEVSLVTSGGKIVGSDKGTLTAQAGQERTLASQHVLSPTKP